MLNIDKNIDEGRDMVERLLSRPPVRFVSGSTGVPNESGVYGLFSKADEGVGAPLYVGISNVGMRNRLRDHWAGITSSDFSLKLTMEGVVSDKTEGRNWIRENVVIRYLVKSEFDMDIKIAEHFAIAVLRPKFNK